VIAVIVEVKNVGGNALPLWGWHKHGTSKVRSNPTTNVCERWELSMVADVKVDGSSQVSKEGKEPANCTALPAGKTSDQLTVPCTKKEYRLCRESSPSHSTVFLYRDNSP
jgi:hypothetical protein